jgi:hypothetical protein
MFHGDYRYGEDPLAFITNFETALAKLPHLSESEKCERFYNHCKSDSDAEDWYENLEKNSPEVVASWSTLVLHFRVKWLGASPNVLLETTETKPANVVAVPTTSRETTTTTTVTDSNNLMTAAEQQDNKTAVGGEEEAKGQGKQDETSKREAEQRELTPVDLDRAKSANATPCYPTVILPVQPTPSQSDDTTKLAKPTANSIASGTAPNASGTRSPASLAKPRAIDAPLPASPAKPSTDGRTKGSGEPPLPLMSPQSAPPHTACLADARASPSDAPIPAKPATTLITGATAPRVIDARLPVSPVKPSTDKHPKASGKPPLPFASPQPAPSPTGSPTPPPQPVRAMPKRALTPQGDVAPRARTPATGAPNDRTPTASVPINPVPIDPDPVNPDPAPVHSMYTNPAPVTSVDTTPDPVSPNLIPTENCTPVTHKSARTALASTMPTDLAPIDPVHVDPVSIASAAPLSALSSHISDIKVIRRTAKVIFASKVRSASPTLEFSFFRVRWREVLDRERGRSLCLGGALVVVSYAHSSGVRGPPQGFGVLLCPLVAIVRR